MASRSGWLVAGGCYVDGRTVCDWGRTVSDEACERGEGPRLYITPRPIVRQAHAPRPVPGLPHLFPYPVAPSILHSANLSVISRPFLGLSLLLFVSSSAPRTASSPASKTPVPPTPASAHPHLLPHTLPTVSYSQLNTAPAPCAPARARTHKASSASLFRPQSQSRLATPSLVSPSTPHPDKSYLPAFSVSLYTFQDPAP